MILETAQSKSSITSDTDLVVMRAFAKNIKEHHLDETKRGSERNEWCISEAATELEGSRRVAAVEKRMEDISKALAKAQEEWKASGADGKHPPHF